MLPFRLIDTSAAQALPLFAYSAGRHHQYYHSRPDGFPSYQIFLIRSGQGLFRDLDKGQELTLSAGQAFAIPPDLPHEYFPLSHEPWHVGFVGFNGSLAAPLLEQTGLLPYSPLQPDLFDSCWDNIGEIWHDSNEAGNHKWLDLSAKLYRLIIRLRDQKPSPVDTLRPPAEEVRNQTLRKALLLMNQHFTETLLISNLASAVGYSPQHFQRLFLQQFSITPHQYLQNLRMERAVQLLQENNALQIQEIARQVGMETNYFVRLFRTTYGQTPGAWRASNARSTDNFLRS